ncbi:MAG: hypothetical protein JWQ33_200 [Ramlibacter sp.]|nr:hypothetical protein [Ramlibacter sp.]
MAAATEPRSPAPATPTDPPEQPGSADSRQTAVTVSMAAVAVLAGFGWAIERRRRMARAIAPDAGPALTAETLHTQEVAPLEPLHRQRSAPRVGAAAKKKLIRFLFWLRSLAGALAILSAIAIVVFRAIELTDVEAGETGLNLPLLAGLLAGWAAYWGCGRLANMLHRAVFNRDHPKFAD